MRTGLDHYGAMFEGNEDPFASYFEIHQGSKVLIPSREEIGI